MSDANKPINPEHSATEPSDSDTDPTAGVDKLKSADNPANRHRVIAEPSGFSDPEAGNEEELPPTATPTPSTAAAAKSSKASGVAIVLSLIAIVGAAAVAWLGYSWSQALSQQINRDRVALEQQLNAQNSAQLSTSSSLQNELRAFQQERRQQNQNLEQLESRLSDAIKQVEAGREASTSDWRLAEAEYLLRLANQRILMEKRPEGALALLRSADEILHALDDVTLFKLRQILAQDIARLEAVPHLDVEGSYLRLAALIEQSRELPTLSLQQQRQLPEMLNQITPDLVDETLKADVQSAFSQALSRLEKLIVIQRHDAPVEPLLSPEQGHYLRQNLQLLLEQAQLALLRQQAGIYQTSLERAEQLVRRYFDTNASAVQALLGALSEVGTLQVSPTLPDISASLSELQKHIKEMSALRVEARS